MTRDPIDGARLSPWFEGTDAELAETVLRRARGPQRRRRWQRRGQSIASLILVFALGHASAHLEWLHAAFEGSLSKAQSAPSSYAEADLTSEDDGVAAVRPDDPMGRDPATLAALSPLDFEIMARSAEGPARSRLLRLAGDRWLTEKSDTTAALRCYRLHLNAEGQVLANADDSWLLSTLKTAL